jgi:hypothetical protein
MNPSRLNHCAAQEPRPCTKFNQQQNLLKQNGDWPCYLHAHVWADKRPSSTTGLEPGGQRIGRPPNENSKLGLDFSWRQGYHSTWAGNETPVSALQVHGQATSTRKPAVTHTGIEALDLSSTAHSVPKCEENSKCGGNR